MDAAPLTTWTAGPGGPGAPVSGMIFQFYRIASPGETFTAGPVDFSDQAQQTLDSGESWGTRAAWYDTVSGAQVSGWSAQKTFTT